MFELTLNTSNNHDLNPLRYQQAQKNILLIHRMVNLLMS
ncbi:hypothetical protein C427_2782 [Paraglaciecola psychrophila 170]|uniref:Uncharacterized protein n=1 Tax=Paraglaciecola psychrophila 170 TaxID=1129794 RepID=K7A5Y9_9ALTE|nr:hypothetical protein C427_2782 [Paraglaciecola psychrophila 170]GAC36248.1 hypothetical protein GPSY_0610 [Paraglaciecola psychrophila 170]